MSSARFGRSHDLEVAPSQNIPALKSAFKISGNKDTTVLELPDLNHLFQTSKTGCLTEYRQINETIALSALDVIGNWIAKHNSTQPASAKMHY